MTPPSFMNTAEQTVLEDNGLSSALRRFLESGRGSLLGSPSETPPLPEAADFNALETILNDAAARLESDFTLDLDSGDMEHAAPLLATLNMGAYCMEAADRLIPEDGAPLDVAAARIEKIMERVTESPVFARLTPLNKARAELTALLPEGSGHFLPWITRYSDLDPDCLERMVQLWDRLRDGTAPEDDANELLPVLATIQADATLMRHLNSEAQFHRSVMNAAGQLARKQHVERARTSAERTPSLLERALSWLRTPTVAGVVAICLVFTVYFATQDGKPVPLGATMEILVYHDGLTVRGGAETKPEIVAQGSGVLQSGDAIQVRFRLDEPAHVRLYHREGQELSLLLAAHLGKGIHVFPEDSKRLRIVDPGKDESIVLVASGKELTDAEAAEAVRADAGDGKDPVVMRFRFE